MKFVRTIKTLCGIADYCPGYAGLQVERSKAAPEVRFIVFDEPLSGPRAPRISESRIYPEHQPHDRYGEQPSMPNFRFKPPDHINALPIQHNSRILNHVVISRSVPDVHNMTGSSGVGAQGVGEGLNTGRGSSAAGVSVTKTQSMYTYRVPAAYLPTDARHLFITVLMVHPGTGVDLNVYRRYKLVTIIGECRFLDEEEVDKSPNCKPVLKPVENCTMAQRTNFHRLLQREFPLEDIATAERLAVQIMQVESVLNNQTLYWTCNAFMPVDEDRVILEKSKLRSLSIRRLEEILSKHYQATPLVAAGTVMAMLGPSVEINFKVHEAAVETLHKSVEVLSKLPTKTRRTLREMPGVIRSVLKGQSLILAYRGSVETREQLCKLSTSALSVMDNTVELVMQTQRGVEGPASFLSDGVSLWHSKVGVEALRKRRRYYVKPRLMLVYDEALYGFSKTLSVVVTVYRKNPFHCGSGLKFVSTDVVKPYIRDDATGMRIRGTPDHPRTLQVALAPDNANFEDTTSQLKASVMLIVKFKVPMEDGSVVVKLNPEFIKYFFMMANVSTLGEIMCECQETGGGDAAIAARSHPVDFTTNLKPLVNVSSEKGGKKDGKKLNFYFIEHLIPILLAALWVNFAVLFYWTMKIAEIDEQTYAETTAKIQVELHGTEGTSGRFTLRDPRCNPYFLLAGSSNGLLLTTAQTLGNIIVLSIFSDSEGTRPSWMLRLCHLLYSVFAWPSGSRFSRIHRLVTILFLGVISMFLVMLFQGFDPSRRTVPISWITIIEVACLTAIIVFIAGVVLQIIFTQADASRSARLLTTTKYTEYTRNPEIKIAYEVPEYRDESAVAGDKDQRSASLYEDRVEEGILPSPLLYAALLVALVVSLVLSAFMVPMGLRYGYEANVAWFQSLILAIFLNNVIIDVLKSIGVTGYVATRKKK
ncbi:hypothetical protein HPB47_023956 [Ixodes persulcatus]|uniref:Uncharacterized protein n=1 Tax=Ixodes persulcatus TaxID=34615 RepID=A0AC60Q5K8_IXOPE|nr:hypothetical protein HPB47_023956 [Ixodes persulcatus]